MDSCDSDKQENKERKESEDGDPLSIFGNIFSTTWVRHTDKDIPRSWSFLLEYNALFLPIISLFFWIIFLVF
jgi:hypothetical protein